MRSTPARSPLSSSLILFSVILGLPAPAVRAQAGQQLFESKVRPILVNRCGSCHGEKKRQGGLQLTTRAGAFRGGDNGPVLVLGDAARSRLIQAVRRDGERKMPPQDKDRLPRAEIEALAQWVAQGAPWPEDHPGIARAADPTSHWAFQPIRKVRPPEVKDKSWPRGAIDRFILARLEEKRLAPSRDAAKSVLL